MGEPYIACEPKVFEITRAVERELSQYHWFIGVFPFGSRVKGYSDEKQNSDYDMYIVTDDSAKFSEIHPILREITKTYKSKGISIAFFEYGICMGS